MKCNIYFEAIYCLALSSQNEIKECDLDLKSFLTIYQRKLAEGKDTKIDREIKENLEYRKSEAQNELRAIKQGLLDIERQFFGGTIPVGVKTEGRKAGTLNIDPACLE